MENERIQALKERQAKDLARAESEEAIRAGLPMEPRFIYDHGKAVSVQYNEPYSGWRDKPGLSPVEVMDAWREWIVTAERWRDGTLSVGPKSVNRNVSTPNAVMDGSHYAELLCQARKYGEGNGPSLKLLFWAEKYGRAFQVTVNLPGLWLQTVDMKIHAGRYVHGSLVARFIGEDARIKWNTGGYDDGSYRLSYYWADQSNFESWLTTQEGVRVANYGKPVPA